MARRIDGKPHEAHKISFKYLHYTIDDIHSSVDSRKGALHTASPYRLILNDGYYYLLAYDDKPKEMRTFRVDRMREVKEMDSPREGTEEYSKIDIKQYTQRVFNMYVGEPHRVVLRFTNDLINAVYDRFGKAGDILLWQSK